MAKNLIIVESPAKVKTIKKFLGSNYEVIASQGHIRDLPKSTYGIDIENDYEPRYITIRGRGPLLASIKKEAKKADKIFLATDPDREGEAISWHLMNALNIQNAKYYRIAFNEITKNAVKNSLKNPRDIDMDLVDAQQARRILDRMVGYEISPLLWKKVKRGLSAGRVQSASLKLIADREKDIRDFIPVEYWTIETKFKTDKDVEFDAKFYGNLDEKIEPKNQEEVTYLIGEFEKSKYKINGIKRSNVRKKQPLPFTTSTMQQEASKKLNFDARKTMRVAQDLYEGVSIKKKGTIGLITYLRTDSTRVSNEAVESAKTYIVENFGENYIGTLRTKKAGSNMQDAHEAIRPTDITLTPVMIKDSLSKEQFKLYSLIWKRFVASMMAEAIFESISIDICTDNGYKFKASTQKKIFPGFLEVYVEEKEEKTDKKIDKLTEKDGVRISEIMPKQHFTESKPRFTEATLIKKLEELGIGRPSTYAPTIGNLISKYYITKDKKQIFITEIGEIVNKIMNDYFSNIVDVNFTASMEKKLDDISIGEIKWKDVIREFYPQIHQEVLEAEEKLEKIVIADEVTDVICEKCGSNMVVKVGPYGKFLGCPNYPDCINNKSYIEKVGVKCPKCGGDVIILKTKKGVRYYGCSCYPECDFVSWNEPTGDKCPKCGAAMVKKGKKIICDEPTCRYIEGKDVE